MTGVTSDVGVPSTYLVQCKSKDCWQSYAVRFQTAMKVGVTLAQRRGDRDWRNVGRTVPTLSQRLWLTIPAITMVLLRVLKYVTRYVCEVTRYVIHVTRNLNYVTRFLS